MISRRSYCDAHNTAVSRRPCRQPAASRPHSERPDGGMSLVKSALRNSVAIEDAAIRRVIERQAGIGLRSATDGEFRRAMWHFDFLERPGWRGVVPSRSRDCLQGRDRDAGQGAAGHRQDRLLHAPDGGSLPVSAGTHRADAEDDHPVAERAAFSRRAARGQPIGLSRHGGVLPGPRRGLSRRGARPLPRRAAAICNSTKSTWPTCATRSSGRSCETAATTRTGFPGSMRA